MFGFRCHSELIAGAELFSLYTTNIVGGLWSLFLHHESKVEERQPPHLVHGVLGVVVVECCVIQKD